MGGRKASARYGAIDAAFVVAADVPIPGCTGAAAAALKLPASADALCAAQVSDGSMLRTCCTSSAGAPPPDGSHTIWNAMPCGCTLLPRETRVLHSTQGPSHFPGWTLHPIMFKQNSKRFDICKCILDKRPGPS